MENGDRILPNRGNDGKFFAIRELFVMGKDTLLHGCFQQLQPLFEICENSRVM
jgi:hypothetical protein